MALFGVSKDELLSILNKDRKRPLTENEVFTNFIRLSILKQIDKIFDRGIVYYIDPNEPSQLKGESIFFRKDRFNADLNLGAKRMVNKFERDKKLFNSLSKLIDYKVGRKLPIYKLNDNPKQVAEEVRKNINPEFSDKSKQFLQNFIDQLAEFNILVFEHIEYSATKERANIKGMFLSPNVIVLNKNRDSTRQEIFTLAHELGHYLLNQEEIDEVITIRANTYRASNDTERWCSDFAYFFLIGEYGDIINSLEEASPENDYHSDLIDDIGYKTQLSRSAIYTRLLFNDAIEPGLYNGIVAALDRKFLESKFARDKAQKEKIERLKLKAESEGKKFFLPRAKPIISPLYERTLRGALYNGLITEQDFCQKLSISSKNLDSYLI